MAALKSTIYSVLFASPKKIIDHSSSKPSKEELFIEFWEEVKLPIATHQDIFFKKRKRGAYKNYPSDKKLLDAVYDDLLHYNTSIKMEVRGEFKKLCKSKKKVPAELKEIQGNFDKAIKRFGRINSERNYDPFEIHSHLENIVMDIDDMIAALKTLGNKNNLKK